MVLALLPFLAGKMLSEFNHEIYFLKLHAFWHRNIIDLRLIIIRTYVDLDWLFHLHPRRLLYLYFKRFIANLYLGKTFIRSLMQF